MPLASVPEQGQLVEVRQRQYVVSNVLQSALPVAALGAVTPDAQHLVSLVSIEDDALGEELQVIWEIEPGARVREQSTLPSPSGFDPPRRLDAFLDAVRWGAVSSADELYGPVLKQSAAWGLLEDDGERLRHTPRGRLLSNEISQRLLPD